MRSFILVAVTSLLITGCGSTSNKVEKTVSAETNKVSTKVCKEKPASIGSRLGSKVCK